MPWSYIFYAVPPQFPLTAFQGYPLISADQTYCSNACHLCFEMPNKYLFKKFCIVLLLFIVDHTDINGYGEDWYLQCIGM